MTKFTKIRRFATGTAAAIRFADAFYVEIWNTKNDHRKVIDRFNFEGRAGELAARAMALGCLDSLTSDEIAEA